MDETCQRGIGGGTPIVGRALCARARLEVHLLRIEHRGGDPVGSAGALVVGQSRGLDFADLKSQQRHGRSLIQHARIAVKRKFIAYRGAR